MSHSGDRCHRVETAARREKTPVLQVNFPHVAVRERFQSPAVPAPGQLPSLGQQGSYQGSDPRTCANSPDLNRTTAAPNTPTTQEKRALWSAPRADSLWNSPELSTALPKCQRRSTVEPHESTSDKRCIPCNDPPPRHAHTSHTVAHLPSIPHLPRIE
eukprot:8687127-Pyramimonas_sp.AAC.1